MVLCINVEVSSNNLICVYELQLPDEKNVPAVASKCCVAEKLPTEDATSETSFLIPSIPSICPLRRPEKFSLSRLRCDGNRRTASVTLKPADTWCLEPQRGPVRIHRLRNVIWERQEHEADSHSCHGTATKSGEHPLRQRSLDIRQTSPEAKIRRSVEAEISQRRRQSDGETRVSKWVSEGHSHVYQIPYYSCIRSIEIKMAYLYLFSASFSRVFVA